MTRNIGHSSFDDTDSDGVAELQEDHADFQGGDARNVGALDADDINSSKPFRVVYYDGATYLNEGYGTLNDAITARDGIAGPTALFIPPGDHAYSTTLTVGEYEAIVTQGNSVTHLNYEGDIRAFHKVPGNDAVVVGGFKLDGTNAAAGTDGAYIEGGIYCRYDAIEATNFPGDGVIIYGEQGAGLYYTNFDYVRGQGCGGHGVRMYSPSGDDRRIQANNFGMVVALNNTGRGFSGENTQNGNQFDVVDCEGNGDDQCYWNLGDGVITQLYTGGSDGGTSSWGLNVPTGGSGRVAVLSEHMEGGTSSEANDPDDRLNMTGANHGLSYAEVSRDSGLKEQYFGRTRSGWTQVFETWNGNWEFYDGQNAQTVASMTQGGVLKLSNSGDIRLGACRIYEDANGEIQAVDSAGNTTQLT